MAKKVPQINASSMADISFLLLIFFLVTTSMDVNQGLARRLPAPIPPDQKVEDKDINKRNLLVVKINSANQLMVQGQLMDVKQLREKAKEFIKNENDNAFLPKLVEEDFGAPFGVIRYTKDHVISVQNDVDTQYQAYLDQELSRVDELNAEDRIDLFTVGTNLLPKYCQGDQEVAMTAGEIGLSESDLVSQFEPLRTLAKGADGEQRAVTYELPVCAWVYRRSIAKEVLGTDDPSRVGAAVQNWDAFEQTAAKMKTSGYQMYSSWMELYDICAAEVSAPWVDEENALRFDDAVVEWIRRTRSDAEKGYVHGSERGSEEWVADMAKNSRVFGFCLTPAEIRTTLAGTDSGKAGDWAVTGGPGSCLDGASWLCAAAGSDNKELTKRVMQTLTTGEESMMDMLTRTGIAVNNRSVMEQAASDRTLTNAVLGGENPFGIWLRAAGKVSVEHRTDYDDGLKQILEASYLPYFKGETDEQSALGNFYAAALTRYPDLLT